MEVVHIVVRQAEAERDALLHTPQPRPFPQPNLHTTPHAVSPPLRSLDHKRATPVLRRPTATQILARVRICSVQQSFIYTKLYTNYFKHKYWK
jgi:hypothetical protein